MTLAKTSGPSDKMLEVASGSDLDNESTSSLIKFFTKLDEWDQKRQEKEPQSGVSLGAIIPNYKAQETMGSNLGQYLGQLPAENGAKP
jgi:hypothetical protein